MSDNKRFRSAGSLGHLLHVVCTLRRHSGRFADASSPILTWVTNRREMRQILVRFGPCFVKSVDQRRLLDHRAWVGWYLFCGWHALSTDTEATGKKIEGRTLSVDDAPIAAQENNGCEAGQRREKTTKGFLRATQKSSRHRGCLVVLTATTVAHAQAAAAFLTHVARDMHTNELVPLTSAESC